MITKEELLKGRDKDYPQEYTEEVSDNLDKLLDVMNQVRAEYNKPMTITSGWRPAAINASTPGAATHSLHQIGLACDISDPNGELMNWVLENLEFLSNLNIYFEDFRWTPNWVHFGIQKPKSGHRIFIPSANRAIAPDKWDGNYDKKYDF